MADRSAGRKETRVFAHVFGHRIKCILRDREMVFWTLLFPVALATFFNMAFSNLNSDEAFRPIPIAVVLNAYYPGDGTLKSTLDSLSDASAGTAVFTVTETGEEEAKELLDSNKVTAYIVSSDTIGIYVRGSGFGQTITKFVFDSILRTNSLAGRILAAEPGAAAGLLRYLSSGRTWLAAGDTAGSSDPNNTLIYFYSLIAMTCFYGAFAGIKEVNAVQADQSEQAKRVNVSPVRKMDVFASSISAATSIQYASILILLLYMRFALRIDFGDQIGYILLLCLAGCLAGVSYGTMIGVLLKGHEGAKIAVLICSTMVLSFLAGMMQVSVKFAVTRAVPALAYLNPLNVITDSFYALYYYPGHARFWTGIMILAGFILVFSAISIVRLRRVRYASV